MYVLKELHEDFEKVYNKDTEVRNNNFEGWKYGVGVTLLLASTLLVSRGIKIRLKG